VYTLDLARAHIRELQEAADRSHARNTLPAGPSLLRRLTSRAARHR
jgi:hypothetical protein